MLPDGRETWLRDTARERGVGRDHPSPRAATDHCCSPSTAPNLGFARVTARRTEEVDAHLRARALHRRRARVADASRRSGSSIGTGARNRPVRCGGRPTCRPPRARSRSPSRSSRSGASSPPSARSSARRSISSSANRHVRNWPSAVMRTRSQLSQNGSVTLGITPTSPTPVEVAPARRRLHVRVADAAPAGTPRRCAR